MTLNNAAKSGTSTTSPPINAEIAELCQPIVDGMTQYNGALCDGYAAMGAEWLNFINRRIHADMSLPGRLTKCRSPQDLIQEWSTFLSTAAEDYRKEFTRLAEMNSTALQRAVSAVHASGSWSVFPQGPCRLPAPVPSCRA